jgi:hypothetical protein
VAAELGEDVGQVGLDGRASHEQRSGDLGLGQSSGYLLGDLQFGRGEAVPARGRTPPFTAGAQGEGHGILQRERSTLGEGRLERGVAERDAGQLSVSSRAIRSNWGSQGAAACSWWVVTAPMRRVASVWQSASAAQRARAISHRCSS